METSVQTKVCIKCGEDKELENFQIHRSSGNRGNKFKTCSDSELPLNELELDSSLWEDL